MSRSFHAEKRAQIYSPSMASSLELAQGQTWSPLTSQLQAVHFVQLGALGQA